MIGLPDTAIAETLLSGNFEMPDLMDVSDFASAWEAFEIPAHTLFAHWCIRNMVNNDGRPYDHLAYPHNLSPGGPADAIDDPYIRTITLQYASRLGKTHHGEAFIQFKARTHPAPAMIASEAEDRTKDLIARLYQQMYRAPHLAAALLKKHRREHNARRIEFRDSVVYGAWPASAGSLADKNICYGHAAEIDKGGWIQKSTAKEGKPINLFDNRFKDYWGVRKVIYESTPTLYGQSEVERRRVAGSDCKLVVPCPHCKTYQPLRLGARDEAGKLILSEPGRLQFQRRADGSLDKDTARKSAHYVCITGNCPPINDEHRRWMMRHAVWLPNGCGVDHDRALAAAKARQLELASILAEERDVPRLEWKGWKSADWIIGEPLRDGPDASYGPLSSLYALALTWGDYAEAFVKAISPGGDMRDFTNGWEGETFRTQRKVQSWEDLCERLKTPVPRYTVPIGYSTLTMAIDKQETQPHYPYGVVAWNEEMAPHLVDYGYVETLEDVLRVLKRKYPHEDGGEPLRIASTLMDSGYRPKDVAPFVLAIRKEHHITIRMCKGASTDLNTWFRISKLGKDTETPGMVLVRIDSMRSQDWVDELIYDKQRESPGALTVFDGENDEHWDLCEQLMNQQRDEQSKAWDKVKADEPDDLRDVLRYNGVAIRVKIRGGKVPPRKTIVQRQPVTSGSGSGNRMAYLDRPGGWL